MLFIFTEVLLENTNFQTHRWSLWKRLSTFCQLYLIQQINYIVSHVIHKQKFFVFRFYVEKIFRILENDQVGDVRLPPPPAPCIPVSTINIFLKTDIDLSLTYKQAIRFHYEIKSLIASPIRKCG